VVICGVSRVQKQQRMRYENQTIVQKEDFHFAPRPDSLARRLFTDEIIDAHLDALVAAQQEDGGWPINWQVWTPATGLEWRGWATIEALKTLRAYGRLS
jgi:hypothetical protein